MYLGSLHNLPKPKQVFAKSTLYLLGDFFAKVLFISKASKSIFTYLNTLEISILIKQQQSLSRGCDLTFGLVQIIIHNLLSNG